MDVAYDHIQEEVLPEHEEENGEKNDSVGNLNTEISEALKAVQSTPWGATLGGFFGQIKKQGETLYTEAAREYTAATNNATKNISDLTTDIARRARAISLSQDPDPQNHEQVVTSFVDPTIMLPVSSTPSSTPAGNPPVSSDTNDSLGKDIFNEAASMVSSIRLNAIPTIQNVEQKADEALFKFGRQVGDFLRTAVNVSAPGEPGFEHDLGFGVLGEGKGMEEKKKEVLFDIKNELPKGGERGINALHQRLVDGEGKEISNDISGNKGWEEWRKQFDVGREKGRIEGDLAQYEELRNLKDKLVPGQVDESDFWTRYYYLRKGVEDDEQKRKEVLKGVATDSEEGLDWGDDDDDDDEVPKVQSSHQDTATPVPENNTKKDLSPMTISKGNELDVNHDDKKSAADSDASYDLVSGTTTKSIGSPAVQAKREGDDEEDDWE